MPTKEVMPNAMMVTVSADLSLLDLTALNAMSMFSAVRVKRLLRRKNLLFITFSLNVM